MRTGLITKKIGMSRIFTETGEHIPVTLLQVDNCQVVGIKSKDKHGYTALQLGAFNKKKTKNLNKSVRGAFAKANVEAKEKVVEFRVADDAVLNVGDTLSPGHFIVGQKVDVVSTTIGKGFAGVMKRWNFRGLEASHGVSVSHRSHGSTGQRQDPGRVFKGKKMAGHLGAEQVTTQNLKVVAVYEEEGLIAIEGAVPGTEGTFVLVKDAVKAKKNDNLPYPAKLVSNSDAAAKQEAPAAEAQAEAPATDPAAEESKGE